MWTRHLGCLAILLIALLSRGAASNQAPALDARLQVFEQYAEAIRKQIGIPGVAAGILVDQRLVWERGFGFAGVDARVATTPTTLFPIASLTKTFTSTLLLQCVERGTLDLDRRIAEFTSAIPEVGATVRHVLTHTSAGTPGARFQYDGNRFAALTSVVAACSGLPYRQAVARLVLDPIAMRDTVPGHDFEQPSPTLAALFDAATLARHAAALTRIARPYTVDSRRRATPTDYPPRDISASAGLVSSIRDLANYDVALDRRVLISDASLRQVWTRYVPPNGEPQPYGLGWFVQPYNGVTLIWHYGQWPQFSALYLKVPERNLTLLLLANSSDLSSRFSLAPGDVTNSSFARVFLRLFVDQ